MNALIALGLGIVLFALIVGVGVVVLANFGGTLAQCPVGYNLNNSNSTTSGYQISAETCVNDTGAFTNTTDPTNVGWTTNDTLMGYLGTNLTTWVPAIIALGVGLLFIGALVGKKQKKY